MNVGEIKEWLKQFDDEKKIKCWIDIEDEYVFSSPNMVPISKEELFNWEDDFSELEYDKRNSWNSLVKMYDFIESFFMALENKLELNPEFIKSLENIEKEESVKIPIKESKFWELVEHCNLAETIDEVIVMYTPVLRYINEKISDADNWIDGNKIYIKQKNNTSLSTSIIAVLLGIDTKNIDDSMSMRGVWSITLE